jgi:predicted glutamine amidotransferase
MEWQSVKQKKGNKYMCKMLAFSVSKKIEQEKLFEIIAKARDLLKDQKDGFGYALSGGDIRGITSLRLTTGTLLGYQYQSPESWEDVVNVPYESKGKIRPCTAGIFHGRTSTNDLGVNNTHPFVNDDLALIHNGIVEYKGERRKKMGTCDSEDLFNTFTIGNGWEELEKHYSGYAGIMILKQGGELTLYRDETPSLHICKVRNGIVAGTSLRDVSELASLFDESPNAPWMLKPDRAVVCKNGEITSKTKVNPMPRRSYGYKDSLSLGSSYGGYSSYSYPKKFEKKSKEKELFPDYEGGITKYSEQWEDGYQTGWEDAVAGKMEENFSGESADFNAGYKEGYFDGGLESINGTSGGKPEGKEEEIYGA